MAKAEKPKMVTLCVVQPFEADGKGNVGPGQAYQASDGYTAVRKAQKLNDKVVGAIAFSRTGDMRTGEFDDAVLLGVFGAVPEDALDAIREGTA